MPSNTAAWDDALMAASVPGTDTWAWLRAWPGDPLATALVLVAASLYAAGLIRLRRAGTPFPARWNASFWCGLAVLAVALLSPIDAYADVSFSIHMTQHLLLTFVAPPLLALGAPITLAMRATSTASGILHNNPDADGTFTVTEELSGPVAVAPQAHYCPQGGGWTLQAVAPGNQYDKNADGFICTKDVPGKPGKGNTGSGFNNKDNNG